MLPLSNDMKYIKFETSDSQTQLFPSYFSRITDFTYFISPKTEVCQGICYVWLLKPTSHRHYNMAVDDGLVVRGCAPRICAAAVTAAGNRKTQAV